MEENASSISSEFYFAKCYVVVRSESPPVSASSHRTAGTDRALSVHLTAPLDILVV